MPADAELIPHAGRCPRRRPPVLLAGWFGPPAWIVCHDCGRRAPAAAPQTEDTPTADAEGTR